jgi:hypothetical protein
MHPADLETFIDAELRKLPPPRAPRTLLPRVLAAVHEWSGRPWYTREWFTWPFGWRVASIAALIMFIGGSAMLLPIAQAAAASGVSRFSGAAVSHVATVVHGLKVTTDVARVVWRTLVEPYVAYLFVVVALMCLACAAFGAALNHVVLGRALQR